MLKMGEYFIIYCGYYVYFEGWGFMVIVGGGGGGGLNILYFINFWLKL